jgi:hypothetical protein
MHGIRKRNGDAFLHGLNILYLVNQNAFTMKKHFLTFYFSVSIFVFSYAQPTGEWMWIHGSNVVGAPAVWGTQGVPSPSNNPPSLYEPCEWKDLNGKFWMFGGGTYAALWKYDPFNK